MKKIVRRLVLLAALVFSSLAANVHAQETVKVAVIGDSTYGIWEVVQKNLGDDIIIELVDLSDPVNANRALIDGEVEFAAFQHYAALEQFNRDNDTDLTAVAETFISPMNILSDSISSVDELQEGDEVIIPESPTNRGRALKVLEHAGLIEIDPEAGDSPETSDITANPLNLDINEVDQAIIMSALPDVAAGLTVANNVLDVGIDPVNDAIYVIEISPDDETLRPYFNLFVTRADNTDNPIFEEIIEAYHQDNVKEHILEEYNNAMIPVW